MFRYITLFTFVPLEAWTLYFFQCCVVSGSVFWDGPITLPGVFYRVRACVFVCVPLNECVSFSVISCNNDPVNIK